MTALQPCYDVLIVGGGMVGASLACLLEQGAGEPPLRILIVESIPPPESSDSAAVLNYQPSFDGRASALAYGSRRIFEHIDLWREMALHISPIERIHVSERGHWGSTVMDGQKEGLEALGYVVENQWLGSVLLHRLRQSDRVDLLCPAAVQKVEIKEKGAEVVILDGGENRQVNCQLVVIADGANSSMCQQLGIDIEQQAYGQSAVIANVETAKSHRQMAYERFTDEGPVALLPLCDDAGGAHRSALIWTLEKAHARHWHAAPDREFLLKLQERFGYRLGRFQKLGRRAIYPVSLIQAKEQVRSGLVVIGNAAHGIHPVAGQGFNLALRDIAALSELLIDAHRQAEPLGSLQLLQQYYQAQQMDQWRTIEFSDWLPRLFAQHHGVVQAARVAGLVALELVPGAKTSLVRFATGLVGREAKIGGQ